MADPERQRLALLACVFLAAVAVMLVGLLVAVVLFLAAAFTHHRVFATTAIGALSVALLGQGLIQGSRTYRLAKFGTWTDFRRRRVTRHEQPVRFMIWLALASAATAVSSAAAGFLIWTTVLPGLHVR